MHGAEVTAFLASLPTDHERQQACAAIVFLYRHVLNRPLDLPLPTAPPSPSARPARALDPIAALLDQVRETLRVQPYAIRMERAYPDWIKRFIRVTVQPSGF